MFIISLLFTITVSTALMALAQRLTHSTGTFIHHQTTFQVTVNTRRPVQMDLVTTMVYAVHFEPINATETETVTETKPYPFVGEITTVNGLECKVNRLTRTETHFTTTVVTVETLSSTDSSDGKFMDEYLDIWSSLNIPTFGKTAGKKRYISLCY